MIYLFTGTPGSGKSLHAARIIRDALKYAKKPVIANFPINEQTAGYRLFTYCPNHLLAPDFLYDYARSYWGSNPVREDAITLVVDEAQLLFNSREWNKNDRMAWIEFLSQHRHFGYRIFFMCQFDRMIDRQIRSLCEYECQHRKVSSFGWRGTLFKLFSFGELFVCVKTYYGMHEKISSEFFRGRKSLFRLYDSYSVFRRVDGDEVAGCSGDPAPIPVRPTESAVPAHVRNSRFPSFRVLLRKLSRRVRGSPSGSHVRVSS